MFIISVELDGKFNLIFFFLIKIKIRNCSNFQITAVIQRVSKEKEKSYRNGNLTRSHVNKCDRIVFDTA